MSVGHIAPAQLDAGTKAALLYAQARAELSGRLWQAALGDGGADAADAGDQDRPDLGFETLVALLASDAVQASRPLAIASMQPAVIRSDGRASSYQPPVFSDRGGHHSPGTLGVNASYCGLLNAAAERTGIPAPALAAIVHAEAAKGSDGRWLTYSRNPRSSAAGLGQFLSGTWIGEAERAGTWLHGVAAGRGWLDAGGRVAPEAHSALLALRYDGAAAIEATADYARVNLNRLRAAGVQIDSSVESIARSAYVSHHLGLGDAIRFLGSGLDPARARTLLRAQIGASAADERIAEAGGATRAHRDWLLGYVSRNVQPARFAGVMGAAQIL